MSLLSLFTRRRREAPPSQPVPSQPRGPDVTQPLPTYAPAAQGNDPGARRHERVSRREHLYAVVRESMNRAGVLSSGYRFKVLSLDGWGKQFLVMVDLTAGNDLSSSSQAAIEQVLAQAALARYDITVKAVYWRQPTAYLATQRGAAPVAPAPQASHSPVPARRPPVPVLSDPVSVPGPAAVRAPVPPVPAAPAVAMPAHGGMDPLGEDEIAAFRSALASSPALTPAPVAPRPTAAPAVTASAAASKPAALLLTGFEDTEVNAEQPRGALSTTQYGDLV